MKGPGIALAFLASCVGGGTPDVVPPSRDVIASAGAHAWDAQGYEYVARRPTSVVALAEARGIDPTTADAMIDHLADGLDTCAAGAAKGSRSARGAARVVARIDEQGRVTAATVHADPGPGVAETAVLCLVAPIRGLTFPPAADGGRGVAVEAMWGAGAGGPAGAQ
ncbi:MAG: hypothetical protein ACREJ3_13395 [Polyangiaceae bacterium]